MSPMLHLIWAAVVAFLGQSAPQQPNANPDAMRPPSVQAIAVAEGPAIDGDVIGDPVWQSATPASGFWQEQPDEGQPSSERTEVRIVYTAATLYVGVICYDRDPAG